MMANSSTKEAWAQNIIPPGYKGESMKEKDALAGKAALVTRASRGIGFAIARRLGRMGARLSVCARDLAKLGQSASALRAEGIEVLAVPADVTSADQIASLVRKIQQELGPIDILVNNAGIGVFGPFHESTERDWNAVMDTNLKSVFLLSRAVAPEMIRRGTGHIINISSLAGKSTFANGALYCASKWGLMGLTGCMAEDLRGHGVRVSAVCPGSVATEFSGRGGKDPAKILQPDDVAHAVSALVTQAPGSFISEVHLRPTRKP
jgi:NAD(P)-dependent dehydrogenase (short-subunit alcohol dehydrogenase family)